MKKVNVLVFPCGSEIGLEIQRALKDCYYVNLIGASSVDDHGKYVYKNYVGDIPFVTDDRFVEAINECVDKYDVDYIFPAMDSVILALSQVRETLHAKLLTSPKETVDICRDKQKTYSALQGCGFLPKVYESVEEIKEYPVIVKPAVGQGSHGFKILNTKEDLVYDLSCRKEKTVICEYLPGKEYTIDCFTDKKGKLQYVAYRQRVRVRNGISVNSVLQKGDDEFYKIAEEISGKMAFRGAWFFQLKRDKQGNLRLLECATRVAGAMCVERAAGVNLALLTLLDAMDLDVSILDQSINVEVDRALENCYSLNINYDSVILDFDDTLVVHGSVNKEALYFCYQCVERNIPIILLTKHDTDIFEDLRRYRISADLFTEVIHIDRNLEKTDYYTATDTTLVLDDSFSERKKFRDRYNSIVLGADAIEALIDHRG
ncbi:MAG: ATP-grasp domain-containing protein [Oscillospiraceae bacterium]|nr:ATP-grasp domain-containing protein [Oscillospiraceae bacterium]